MGKRKASKKLELGLAPIKPVLPQIGGSGRTAKSSGGKPFDPLKVQGLPGIQSRRNPGAGPRLKQPIPGGPILGPNGLPQIPPPAGEGGRGSRSAPRSQRAPRNLPTGTGIDLPRVNPRSKGSESLLLVPENVVGKQGKGRKKPTRALHEGRNRGK